MENVAQINPYERMLSWNQPSANPRRRKLRKRRGVRRLGSRFRALTRLASDTHQRLVEKGSPLRLCVYSDDKELFMDVITMDKTKQINKSFTRPITNESLKTLIKRIHNQMGLVLDYSL